WPRMRRRITPASSPPLRAGNNPRCSAKRPQLDVAKRDRELLILQPQVAVRELRVVDVERRLAVEDDDDVIPLGGDLVAVPLVGLEAEVARRLRGADNRAGVVAGRLQPPDLHLVAAVL